MDKTSQEGKTSNFKNKKTMAFTQQILFIMNLNSQKIARMFGFLASHSLILSKSTSFSIFKSIPFNSSQF